MRNVMSRAVRSSVALASVLLATTAVQGTASASAQDTYRAVHGSDTAVVWIASETVYVNDGENDGLDVVGQVRWWDSQKAQTRTYSLWDRSADGDHAIGNAPGPVSGIRVCEEDGSCSPWQS
ncbi:hypothetical protein Misp01_20320 [Microtetraspora sp. NBRC 13810]|uniref:hypothetical protein n=1 Tax=Microtetraspora sp. NBRC 13810 TaxID=3030990 RepID=UPI0024A3A8BE|nr:hypothetical protein [Microtetraspora sp. NBRC 13810]GLW06902.1 hypothetical protein Misp01_20320 [Microtetraspora sp. NBRC 13810]